MTEDEMVGWHRRIDGHEFEKAPGVGDGQGSLRCFSPWGCKGSDTTEQLICTEQSKRTIIDTKMIKKSKHATKDSHDTTKGKSKRRRKVQRGTTN